MIVYLTTEDLLALTRDLGVGPVRDLGLLASAVHRPSTSLWGSDEYAGVILKAATLLDLVLNTHGLVDGNKRLGWLATLVFLDLNGLWVEAPDEDAYDLVVAVASGEVTQEQTSAALARWVQQ